MFISDNASWPRVRVRFHGALFFHLSTFLQSYCCFMASVVLDELGRLERPILFGARPRASAGAAGASSQLVAVEHPDLENLVARASG